jgi:hypothetical protein
VGDENDGQFHYIPCRLEAHTAMLTLDSVIRCRDVNDSAIKAMQNFVSKTHKYPLKLEKKITHVFIKNNVNMINDNNMSGHTCLNVQAEFILI